MSTLLYTSPRSSPSPHHLHHAAMARHQVAFGQSHQQQSLSGNPFGSPSAASITTSSCTPGNPHQPGVTTPHPAGAVSSFGFGFASGAQAAGSGYNRNSSPAGGSSYTSPFKLPSHPAMAMASPGPSTSSNRRRRRRSDSPDERDRDMDGLQQHSGRDDSLNIESTSGKRVRRELRPMKSMSTLAASAQAPAQNTQSSNSNEFDVGKALASLSKPALLSVLTSLLATQPSLKPVVLSLLPAPSLESFTSTLQVAEKRVLDALPVGRNLRDEYIWSRIRAPLEEYIAEGRLALTQFCPSSSLVSEQDISNSQEQQHPASIFAFLYTLTLSIRKLEIILPRAPLPFGSSSLTGSGSSSPLPSINNPSSLNQNDPLVCFLPALINQWHVLVTKLSNLVNQNGRVLSAEMVRTWFKQLDSLVDVDIAGIYMPTSQPFANENDASSVGRKATEAIRERFIKELGWLVGIRTPAFSMNTQGNQVQGGIQAVANQFMDSRMMMTENDESDEEL